MADHDKEMTETKLVDATCSFCNFPVRIPDTVNLDVEIVNARVSNEGVLIQKGIQEKVFCQLCLKDYFKGDKPPKSRE